MPSIGNTPRPAYVYDTETDTWVPIGVGAHTHDDAYVNQTIIDAKGDLIVGTADNSYSRLGRGADGTVLVSDSTTSTGLAWQPYAAPVVAGKNKIINGDFRIWQRGTSFSTANTYSADRFLGPVTDGSIGTFTVTRETFSPGTAPVSSYDGQYFWRYNRTVAGSGGSYYGAINQRIEDVRTLSGQTATFSFWAKGTLSGNLTAGVYQAFGTGGSGGVNTIIGNFNITTSWTRYSFVVNVPSVVGKTIGEGSFVSPYIDKPISQIGQLDIWGMQFEIGNVATPFTTATGTIQGELAACQRYYYRSTPGKTFGHYGFASSYSTSQTRGIINFPVSMRVVPTSIEYSGIGLGLWGVADYSVGTVALIPDNSTFNLGVIETSGSSGLTSQRIYQIENINNVNGHIAFNAEL